MKVVNIITHNADFHTDEVFAVAILLLMLGKGVKSNIIRTRDESVIQTGDYVVDVGGMYDETLKRFDHHQIGGAGIRENGVPYASCGLVWKAYGKQIAGSEEVALHIDEKIISPLDASDNGVDTYTPRIDNVFPYLVQNFISSFNPTWKEDDAAADQSFMQMVAFAQTLLLREIAVIRDVKEGEKYVQEAYELAEDKRLIILDNDYNWYNVVLKYSEPLFVVYPNSAKDMWRLKTIQQDRFSYKSRKDLPEAWAGKKDAELQMVTGVSDAVFCHNKRFTSAARSKEGALALAHLALEN